MKVVNLLAQVLQLDSEKDVVITKKTKLETGEEVYPIYPIKKVVETEKRVYIVYED